MDLDQARSLVIMAEKGVEGIIPHRMTHLGGVVNITLNSRGHPMGCYLALDL
jgi:hypothetical protein